MNNEKINKLENEIESKSYFKSNKEKNNIWFFIGILFQILNVVICFFGLYLFLSRVIDDFPAKEYIIGSISILILSFWEKLKRIQIRNNTMSYLKEGNKLTKNNIIQFGISLFLIICSSLIAIKGGMELSDKKSHIEINTESNTKGIRDSINVLYNNEITQYKQRVDFIYKNAKYKNGDSRSLNKNELTTINDLDNKILKLKVERDSLITNEISKVENKSIEKNKENTSVVKIFVITSLLFELFILLSISFCTNFDFKSYFEIVDSDKYRKKNLFLDYLDVIFENQSMSKDDKCMSEKKFIEIIKTKFNKTNNIKEFLTIISFLKIIISKRDKRKYFNKNYKESVIIIEEYFKD